MRRIGQSEFRIVIFFLNATAPTEFYALSLHDALPILRPLYVCNCCMARKVRTYACAFSSREARNSCGEYRSEEHTSELQSRRDLVCRLLLEKKNKKEFRIAINLEMHSQQFYLIHAVL